MCLCIFTSAGFNSKIKLELKIANIKVREGYSRALPWDSWLLQTWRQSHCHRASTKTYESGSVVRQLLFHIVHCDQQHNVKMWHLIPLLTQQQRAYWQKERQRKLHAKSTPSFCETRKTISVNFCNAILLRVNIAVVYRRIHGKAVSLENAKVIIVCAGKVKNIC